MPGLRSVSIAAQARRRLLRRREIEVRDHHTGASLAEASRDACAYTSASAGDDDPALDLFRLNRHVAVPLVANMITLSFALLRPGSRAFFPHANNLNTMHNTSNTDIFA